MIYRMLIALFISSFALLLPVNAAEGVLLSMPEPPEGMSVTKQALRVEDEVVGYHVQLADEQGVSKVIVQIETSYDRSKKEARVAGLKGYVNGIANGLRDAGYELVSNTVPQLKNADFSKPMTVEMEFSKSETERLLVRQFIFFTSKGFNVQVVSNDEQELESLSEWAKHIRPARNVKEIASNRAEVGEAAKPAKLR